MIRRLLSLLLLCAVWAGAAESVEVLPGVYMRSEPGQQGEEAPLAFVIFDIEQGAGKPPLRHRLNVEELRPAEYGGKAASADDMQLLNRYFSGERRTIPRQWDAEAGILYGAREVNSKIGKYWFARLTQIRSDMWRSIIVNDDDCRVVKHTNLKPWLFTYCYFDGGNIGPGMEYHIIIQDVRVNQSTGAYEGSRCIVYDLRTLRKVEDTLELFRPEKDEAPLTVMARNHAALQALQAEPDTLAARVFVWLPDEWRGEEYSVSDEDMPRLREIIRHIQVNPECLNRMADVFPANRYLQLCLQNEQGRVHLCLHPDRIITPRKVPDWKKENERRNYPFKLPDEELHRELVEIVERTLPAEIRELLKSRV